MLQFCVFIKVFKFVVCLRSMATATHDKFKNDANISYDISRLRDINRSYTDIGKSSHRIVDTRTCSQSELWDDYWRPGQQTTIIVSVNWQKTPVHEFYIFPLNHKNFSPLIIDVNHFISFIYCAIWTWMVFIDEKWLSLLAHFKQYFILS